MNRIEFGERWLRIENSALFGMGADTAKRLFVKRIFKLPEIESVLIEPAAGVALIRFQKEKKNLHNDFRQSLLSAVSGEQGELEDSRLPVWPINERVILRPFNDNITTLTIKQSAANRLALSHPEFKKDAKKTAYRVKRMLEALPEVKSVSVFPLSGTVKVRYSAGIELAIIRKAEALIVPYRLNHPLPKLPSVAFGAANVNMLLCTVGQFMFPAMIPIASGVLVISRYDQIREAAQGLFYGKVNVPAFQSVVLACSVATGAPLASALGEWLSCYWQRRWRKKVAVEAQELLDETLPIAGRALLFEGPDTERLVEVAELNAGDIIKVGSSELIPVDGKVISGEALVSETALSGIPGVRRKSVSDPVYASSLLISGNLIVQVTHGMAQTRSAQMAGNIAEMTTQLPVDRELKQRELQMAQPSVWPNLAIASVGVATGGLHTASAILHQDWISGPGISLPTQVFQEMREGLQYGALVHSATALMRLTEADVLVIDGDCTELTLPLMQLNSIHTELTDSDALVALSASVALALGDAYAEALLRICSERELALLEPDAVVLESECSHALIEGHKFSLLHQDSAKSHALLLQVDGVAVAKLAFAFSAMPIAAAPITALKELGLLIVVISSKSDTATQKLARSLGADLASGAMGCSEKERFLRRLRSLRHKPAYLAYGSRMTHALAQQAYVSITVGGGFEEGGLSDITILSERLDPLLRLLALGRKQESQVGASCSKAVLPNLLCIAGAFTGVLNGATSTLLANVGVSGVDQRQRRILSSPVGLRKNADVAPGEQSYCLRLFEAGLERYADQSKWTSVYSIETA